MTDEYNSAYRSVWMYLYDVPFTQGFVNAEGVRTRYLEAGDKDAPPVILLHGTGASWEGFAANIRELARDFRVIALDMIGSGLTDKPDKVIEIPVYVDHVRAVMDAMAIEKASFVGVSLGTFVALKFAQTHPDRANKLTLVAAFGRPMAGGGAGGNEQQRRDIEQAKADRLGHVRNPTWAAMEQLFNPLILRPEDRMPDLVAIRQAIYRQPGAVRAMENIFGAYEPDTFNRSAFSDDDLAKIEHHSLVIVPVDCHDASLQVAKDFARLLPNATAVELSGTLHWAQYERADAFNQINREFLLATA